MNWINDMFSNKGMEKEASQTDREQEFTRKVKSTNWLEGALADADALGADFPSKPVEEIQTPDEARQIAMDWQSWQSEQSLSYEELAKWELYFQQLADKFSLADEFAENGIVAKSASKKCKECGEADAKGPFNMCSKCEKDIRKDEKENKKEAAYQLGDDMEETIKKDYELALSGMSNHNIAEMLAEHILMADGLASDPLKMSEEKEKQLKSVEGNRSAAESKLLKLIGEHTMIDWKAKFKSFRDAKPVEVKESELYEPKFEPKKQNWEKKEDFEAPSDKEKTEQMAGTGKEEEKGAIADEIKSKASKEEIVAIFKTAEVASPWVASKDEQGNDVIAKVEPETNTKESEKDKDDLVK